MKKIMKYFPLAALALLVTGFCSCQKDKFAEYSNSLFEEDSETNPFTIDSLSTFKYAGHPNTIVYYKVDSAYWELYEGCRLSFYENGTEVRNQSLGTKATSYVVILRSLYPGTYYYKFCLKNSAEKRSRFSEEKFLVIP